MSQLPSRETIVVGIDRSAACTAALRWASGEARRRNARLHAVHVVEPDGRERPFAARDLGLALEAARRTVPGRVADQVFAEGTDVDVAVSVVTGEVATQLAREAGDAALVVIGAPDSLRHRSLPHDLATRCLCPVATVGPLGEATYADVPPARTKGASHARP